MYGKIPYYEGNQTVERWNTVKYLDELKEKKDNSYYVEKILSKAITYLDTRFLFPSSVSKL